MKRTETAVGKGEGEVSDVSRDDISVSRSFGEQNRCHTGVLRVFAAVVAARPPSPRRTNYCSPTILSTYRSYSAGTLLPPFFNPPARLTHLCTSSMNITDSSQDFCIVNVSFSLVYTSHIFHVEVMI